MCVTIYLQNGKEIQTVQQLEDFFEIKASDYSLPDYGEIPSKDCCLCGFDLEKLMKGKRFYYDCGDWFESIGIDLSYYSFTPGEWTCSHRKGDDDMYNTEVYTKENPKETIATLHWYPQNKGNGVTGTYRESNAKLISAAPDLLNALIELKKWVGKQEDWKGEDPPTEVVDSALTKALNN